MIRCTDNSIYTGITNNFERRLEEHKSKDKKCAKYTLRRDIKNVEVVWETENRKDACKLEYHIKKLPKIKKEEIIVNDMKFIKYLNEKVEVLKYRKIE